MKDYVFFREEGFYIVQYASNKEARQGAEGNKGTVKVEDINGKTIWKAKK